MPEPEILEGRFAFVGTKPRIGGQSVVRKAIDLHDGAAVAVKLVGSVRDEITLKVFQRELKSLRSLSHPNVVKLIEGGIETETGQPYLVLEWIDRNLSEVWEASGIPSWQHVADNVAEPLISALAHAHLKQVEHRDIKPANVLVRETGEPVLADFGISKLRESLEQSELTVAGFRSGPYAPPERQAPMRYVRDVYSMGILLIQAMHSARITDFHEVAPALASIAVPPDVRDLLERCVSPDPGERPENGSVLLEELHRVDRVRQRSSAAPKWSAWLRLTGAARTQVSEALAADQASAEVVIEEDLSGDVFAGLRFDQEKGAHDRGTVFLVGERGRYTVKPDASSGALMVTAAKAPDFEDLEGFRTRSLLINRAVSWSCRKPTGSNAVVARDLILDSLEDFHVRQAEQSLAHRERIEGDELFDLWENLLKAREEVARGDRKPLRYHARRGNGREVTFTLSDAQDSDLIGNEVEVVVAETNRSLGRGEIIDQEGDKVVVRSGRQFPSIPERGFLNPYLGPTQVALYRQQEALEAVRDHNASRPALKEIILDPSINAAPVPVEVGAWVQDLDATKKEAVAAALGATDVLLVQGPPGTGKTSFIAETIAQFLRADHSSRVLLVSQTHVAVDNALERLAAAGVSGLVRLGEPDDPRIAPAVWPHLLDRQMSIWAKGVRDRAEEHLQREALDAGIPTPHLRAALALQRFLIVAREQDAVEVHLAQASTQPDSELATSLGLNVDAVALQGRLDRLAEQRQEVIDEAQRHLAGDLTVRNEITIDEAKAAIDILVGESGSGLALLRLLSLQAEWLQRVASDQNLATAFLKTTRVLAGTCLGFLRYPGVRVLDIDLCVLDEASKATSTEALVPLARARRWVLVGDTNQLPPLDEDLLRNREVLTEYNLDDKTVLETLFQRFAEHLPTHSTRKLLEQYRMIRPIGDLISSVFYGGELRSPRTSGLEGYELIGKPVLWMDTSRLGAARHENAPEGATTSFTNRTETRVVLERLGAMELAIDKGYLALVEEGVPLEVLVIAPYRAQVDDLRRRLAGHHFKHLNVVVQSVDAVQGREADIAIFSVTRSNLTGSMGFLGPDYWRRINVALSRARFGLTIVGDVKFCHSIPGALRAVVEHIKRHPSDCEIRVIDHA